MQSTSDSRVECAARLLLLEVQVELGRLCFAEKVAKVAHMGWMRQELTPEGGNVAMSLSGEVTEALDLLLLHVHQPVVLFQMRE